MFQGIYAAGVIWKPRAVARRRSATALGFQITLTVPLALKAV